MVITDQVFGQIRTQIAAYAPERGGALYGPRGFPFVTHFEFDPDGLTSAVSYVPSSRLIANVQRVEQETGLQFKGIVHSHPDGFIRPSLGDEQTVGSFFRLNPHFAAMALPIVQQQRGAEPFLRWYRAERREDPVAGRARLPFGQRVAAAAAVTPGAGVEVLDEEFHVLPIAAHVERIVGVLREAGLELTPCATLQSLKVQNAELVGLVAASAAGHEFMYFVSIDYPVVPPVVLCQVGGTTEQLRFAWDGFGDPERCLQVIARTLALRWRPEPAQPPAAAAASPAVTVPTAASAALPTAAPADGFVPYAPTSHIRN